MNLIPFGMGGKMNNERHDENELIGYADSKDMEWQEFITRLSAQDTARGHTERTVDHARPVGSGVSHGRS
jgi:hypothetical protein